MMPWDPMNVPGPGWPGATVAESNAAWATGLQLTSLKAWPIETSSGTPLECWKMSVLRDTSDGWKGQCHDLEKMPSQTSLESCQASCKESTSCLVWQWRDTNECYQGDGLNCDAPESGEPAASIVRAQRLQHGDVRVLKDMLHWEVLNLRPLGFWTTLTPDQSVQSCREYCYSKVTCQYWQYGEGGCFVEDPTDGVLGLVEQYRAQYPLTAAGGATQSSTFAASELGAEYIQHVCPAHPAPNTTTGAPSEDEVWHERLHEPTVIAGLAAVVVTTLAVCIGLCYCCCSGSSPDEAPTSRRRGLRRPEDSSLLKLDDMSETSSVFMGDSFYSMAASPTSQASPTNGGPKPKEAPQPPQQGSLGSPPGYMPVATQPPPSSASISSSSTVNSFIAHKVGTQPTQQPYLQSRLPPGVAPAPNVATTRPIGGLPLQQPPLLSYGAQPMPGAPRYG